MKSYFKLGGMQIQFNVLKQEDLISAQSNPEKYRDLLVRVAGYSAYFVDMAKEAQDEVIGRFQARWCNDKLEFDESISFVLLEHKNIYKDDA